MRCLVHLAAILVLAVACSPGIREPHGADAGEETPPELVADPGYPVGYEEWTKLNSSPIIRKDTGDARDLFANAKAEGSRKGPFPVGTVLVKAQSGLDNAGRPTQLSRISVMTKGTDKANNGWMFAVFDADTRKAEPIDVEVCTICHAQRTDSDFVFSDRSKF